ncbi:hypothetical protein [Runella rosea]|nr:hypothetical protein [Runella rosea]
MKEDKQLFYILALDWQWAYDSAAVKKLFKDSTKVKKLVLTDSCFSDEDRNIWLNTNIEEVKAHILEKYLYSKYRLKELERIGIPVKKIITPAELKVLKQEALLGYIMAHKTINYQQMLILQEESQPFLFIGESIIRFLKVRIDEDERLREGELKELSKFLDVIDNTPFIVVIDKDLYFHLSSNNHHP